MSSDDVDSNSGNGRSGGQSLGGASEPLPSSWNRPSQAPRVGRIGDWSGTSSGGQRSGSMGGGPPGGLRSDDDDDDDDDDDSADKGETWFAGGERSGISVQNPNRAPRVSSGNMVRDLLRRAAEGGRATTTPTSSVFSGGGHTLGSDDVASSFVPDPNARNEDVAIRHITFWRNGFTVENGELMLYDDPNNAQILSQIHSGNAPPSVLGVRVGQEVEVRIDKRLGEDYVLPKGVKAFTGSGNRLGVPVPTLAPEGGGSASAMPGAFPSVSGSSPAAAIQSPRESPSTRFEVDQTLPTTSVQIRLADGTRMVCRMNLTHKVLDLRNFINASRPENSTRPYTIGTTFPNRTLDDDDATIEGAGLANSVVVQRWV